MTHGDSALDSCAQFLAVAEYRLFFPGPGLFCHQVRNGRHQFVWSPACQNQVAGGHAGVGVVWWGALFCHPGSLSLLGKEEWSISLLFMGIRGRGRILISCGSLRSCYRLSLVEAQVVCIGQPLPIAGDLNADPAVIPGLADGISAGRFVDLAFAYSLGAGRKPDAACKFRWEDCVCSVGTSLSVVPMR